MAGEWMAQLPDDLKENEAFTSFETIGDFAKAHLDTVGKASELDGRVNELQGKVTTFEESITKDYIPKLTEQSTPEEKSAFFKALGVPEKAEDYEFPKGEGVEHDEAMTNWARDTFHKANLSKDQATLISQAWDGFIQGLNEEINRKAESSKTEADEKLKTDWGADYDENLEITKRAFQKFSGAEFDAFLDETGLGNHPVLIRAFFEIGKAMGDDTTPPGTPLKQKEGKTGMMYDKSPKP